MFKSEADLKELYRRLVSQRVSRLGAREITGFPAKKLAGTFRGDYVSSMIDRRRYRLAGMRIKHRLEDSK